jgi:hypothetical protein
VANQAPAAMEENTMKVNALLKVCSGDSRVMAQDLLRAQPWAVRRRSPRSAPACGRGWTHRP